MGNAYYLKARQLLDALDELDSSVSAVDRDALLTVSAPPGLIGSLVGGALASIRRRAEVLAEHSPNPRRLSARLGAATSDAGRRFADELATEMAAPR